MENTTPCKYKTVKDIEKPFGIYHYVGESSCCAKIYRNRITHFGRTNRGSFSFFTYKHTQTHRHTHTHTHTHKQYLSSRLQVTNMDRIERINAHYTWFQVAEVPFGGLDDDQLFLGVQTPKKPKFWGVNRHFKPILQKFQSPISSKLRIGLAQNLTGWCSPTNRISGWSYTVI